MINCNNYFKVKERHLFLSVIKSRHNHYKNIKIMMKNKLCLQQLRYILDNHLKIDNQWIGINFFRTLNWKKPFKSQRHSQESRKQQGIASRTPDGYQTAEDQSKGPSYNFKKYLCIKSNKNCHKKCSHPLNKQYEEIFQFGSIFVNWGPTNSTNLHLFFEDLKQQKLLQKYSFRELLGCLVYNLQRIHACCYAFYRREELKQKNVYYIQKWVREKQEGNQDLKFYEYGSTIIQKTLEILTKQFFKEVTINEIKQQLFYSMFGLFAWNPYYFREWEVFHFSVIFCALILKFKLDITSEVIVQSVTQLANLKKYDVNYVLMWVKFNKESVEEDLKKKDMIFI